MLKFVSTVIEWNSKIVHVEVQRSEIILYFCLLFAWRKFVRCFALATARTLSPGIPDVYIGQQMRVAPIDRPGIRVQGRASRVSEAAPVSRVTSYYHIRILNMRTINVKLCRTFQSDPEHPDCLHRHVWVAQEKKVARIMQHVMLLFYYANIKKGTKWYFFNTYNLL